MLEAWFKEFQLHYYLMEIELAVIIMLQLFHLFKKSGNKVFRYKGRK